MTKTRDPEPDLVDLSIPVEDVCRIIELAQRFDLKVGNSDPTAGALDDEDEAAVFEHRPSDPVEIELRSAIADLSDDQKIDLVTLLWIGRDDGTAEDWKETRSTAAGEHNDRTADYLCGTPLLADHLLAGLDAVGRDCSAVRTDRL